MSLRNYGLTNTCFCKDLKSYVSVQPRAINMLKGPKQCCNLHDSSLPHFFITLGKF